MSRFEPLHELALETAIGVLVAQRDSGRHGMDDAIYGLRDLYQKVVACQVLDQAAEQQAQAPRGVLRTVPVSAVYPGGSRDGEPTDDEIYGRAYEPDTRDEHHRSL